MSHRAFVALSGGGAKGIVHVGALKALEDRDVQLIGLSGTSAGAIAAVLTAAKFRADDLINSATGETILGRLNALDPTLVRATDLFGRNGWWRIRLFRLGLNQPLPISLLLALAWATPPIVVYFLGSLVRSSALLWALGAWVLTGLLLWLLYRGLIGGIADTARFRTALAKLLQEQMFPNEPDRIVRMSDFGVRGYPMLKIVSANLTTRRLHLFSADRTPEVSAAHAVTASMCLPVIFQPVNINEELHVDGGIVSNLPAWPFDEERELDPEALTLSVEIEATTDHRNINRFSWVAAAIDTGLFGSGELNLRIAGPTEQLALPTKFGLLDFDKAPAEAAREVADVAKAAGIRLDRRLFRLPEIYRDACKVVQALTLDALNLPSGGTGGDARIRVAIGKLERGYVHSLRLSYSVGYEDDPDEGMLLPIEGSVAGTAWRERQSLYERYPLPSDKDLPGIGNRLRRKCRWGHARWIMCVPILDGEAGEPRLVVLIEGNRALRQGAKTEEALGGLEGAVLEFFDLIMKELKELEDANDPEK